MMIGCIVLKRCLATGQRMSELDTDDPFWEFIDEPKYLHEEEESEQGIVAEEVEETKILK